MDEVRESPNQPDALAASGGRGGRGGRGGGGVRRARALLLGGALLSAAGIALAGTANREIGGVLVTVGWLALVAGIHAFGRAGNG